MAIMTGQVEKMYQKYYTPELDNENAATDGARSMQTGFMAILNQLRNKNFIDHFEALGDTIQGLNSDLAELDREQMEHYIDKNGQIDWDKVMTDYYNVDNLYYQNQDLFNNVYKNVEIKKHHNNDPEEPPEDPEEPPNPEDPEEPPNPEEPPEDPDNPEDPEEPSNPEDPEEPPNPEDPEEPSNPEEPPDEFSHYFNDDTHQNSINMLLARFWNTNPSKESIDAISGEFASTEAGRNKLKRKGRFNTQNEYNPNIKGEEDDIINSEEQDNKMDIF
jgi:hypothetical protein